MVWMGNGVTTMHLKNLQPGNFALTIHTSTMVFSFLENVVGVGQLLQPIRKE
jgi:hypothetical protein